MADTRAVCTFLDQQATLLLAGGQPLQAIKCLEALAAESLLPVDEAATRLKLARALLGHADNASQAKQHLLKAQLLLQKIPGQLVLKCEVAAQLAHAYMSEGVTDYRLKALRHGLALTQSGVSVSDRPFAPAWACYFHAQLAEVQSLSSSSSDAIASLEAGLAIAQQHGLMKETVLFLLFKLHLLILFWDRAEAEVAISALADLLKELPQDQQQQQHQVSPILETQFKLHFNVLQVLFNLKLGAIDALSLSEGGANVLISSMEQQAGALAPCQQQQLEYTWLEPALHGPLVHMLAAWILKPEAATEAKLTSVHSHVDKGLVGVDVLLQQRGVEPNGSEQQLDPTTCRDCRLALALKVALQDCRFQLHLLSCQFAAARADLAANIQLQQRFPQQLKGLVPLLHLESGMLAQLLGYHDFALAHFTASGGGHPCKLHRVTCDALRAAAVLAQGDEGAVGRAVEALGPYYQSLSPGADPELGYSQRSLAYLAAGVSWLKQGVVLEAKQRLGRGLQLAYKQLSNHQLVSQLLLFMVPTHMMGQTAADRTAALNMAKSSVTLARGAGDVATIVAALKMAERVFEGGSGPDQDAAAAAQSHNYLLKKQEELSQRLQAADAEGQELQLVLGWGLQQQA